MMSTPVMFVLSALLVTMVTCSQQPADNYKEGGMDGTWYIVATATHGWSGFNHVSMTTVEVTSTPSELTAVFSMPKRPKSRGWCVTAWFVQYCWRKRRSTCESSSQVFTKDETTAGLFTYQKDGKDYEVVVKQYQPTHGYAVIRTAVGDQFINELYSREALVNDGVKRMFYDDAMKDGNIPGDKVKILDNTVKC